MDKLLAGYGERVVTPPMGVELCGYGYYRGRRAESVLDDLKTRAVCVTSGGTTLFLIACDLVGFDVETSDTIRKAIANEHHIPIENILLACTHTHSGPATQFLCGCGEVSPEYVQRLPKLIADAARRAALDRTSCEMKIGSEQAEPIGFNRRFKSFNPVDSAVSAVIFERKDLPICVFAYACHAVTLGPNAEASADWPGAAVRAMERDGYRCVCFQGFCGDIDPVCNLNQWGKGSMEDLTLYGTILKRHVLSTARKEQVAEFPMLSATERRISLPLDVPPAREFIVREHEIMLSKGKGETWKRFMDEWQRAIEKAFDQFKQHPSLDNVPIQVMRLDGMNIIALPAEVFCEYGLKLRPRFSPLMTIGYANGNTGYWPVKTAYAEIEDYEVYLAPKIYQAFPFKPAAEDVILDACRILLEK